MQKLINEVKQYSNKDKWDCLTDYWEDFQKFIDSHKEYCFDKNYFSYVHEILKSLLKWKGKSVSLKEFSRYIRGEINFSEIEGNCYDSEIYYPGISIYIEKNENNT